MGWVVNEKSQWWVGSEWEEQEVMVVKEMENADGFIDGAKSQGYH